MEAANYSHSVAYAFFCTALKKNQGDIFNALKVMLIEMDVALTQSSRSAPVSEP
jgi:hypothetical protein